MKRQIYVLTAILLVMTGCGRGRDTKSEKFVPKMFPEVQAPAMIEDGYERAAYMAEHYFDGLTDIQRTYPCDSNLVSGVTLKDVEQHFSNYAYLLNTVGYEQADKSIGRLFDRLVACEKASAESNVFESIVSLAELYLYDPNSPVRDEDLYWSFASRLALCQFVEPMKRDVYARQAQMTSLNRAGTKAADFRFSDAKGRIRSLYDIKADWTLLFFSNPGCEACMSIINTLNSSPALKELIEHKGLAVLNIYIDEDIEAWYGYMSIYPDEWYNGFDPEFVIRNETLYDVRAIPSLYVLDAEKNVVMKDAPEQKVFSFLENILENIPSNH